MKKAVVISNIKLKAAFARVILWTKYKLSGIVVFILRGGRVMKNTKLEVTWATPLCTVMNDERVKDDTIAKHSLDFFKHFSLFRWVDQIIHGDDLKQPNLFEKIIS